MSIRQDAEMEAAINGGTVALCEIARQLGLVSPAAKHLGIHPSGQQVGRGGGAENDARARPRRASKLANTVGVLG
jgi:hypothetical protein